MKTLPFLLATLIIFSLNQCTSNEEETTPQTPESVLTAFSKMFPEATEVEWDAEDENNWEAEFILGENSMEAEFSREGAWLKTETELHKVDIPEVVIEAILAKYPKCEWRGFEEVRSENFLAYEVELIYQGEEIELMVTGSGQILEDEGGEGIEKNEQEAV